MLTQTAILVPCCLPTAGVESLPVTTVISYSELTLACNVYDLLHYVPSEYFTRPVRTELVKRAMAADVQICIKLESARGKRSKAKKKDREKSDAGHQEKSHTEDPDDGESNKWPRRLISVRVFLQRMGELVGTPNHSVSSTFLPCIALMQIVYEDFPEICQTFARPSVIIFPSEGAHECHPRFGPITRCVRFDPLSSYMLTMISILGASCAHRNQRQRHPSPVLYLRS